MDKKQLFELIGEASETYVTEEPVISKNNYFSGRKRNHAERICFSG